MSNYLATLTVKALREIAKQIGLRFISRYRKAELITLIVAEINACHVEAAREDKIRTRQNAPKISLMDYPAVDGRVVTQVHGDICKTRGHVSYVKNGMDMGFCPRCGNVTTSEEQITDEEIDPMGRIREVMTNGTAFQPAFMKNDSEEKEMDAIKSIIKVANDAITALMPSLIASRTVFESVRDSGVASEEMIGYAYQAYTDTYRAIKEYERTIAYAEDV